MQKSGLLIAMCFVSLIFQLDATGQVVMRQSVEGGDGVFHLKEIQSIITSANDSVKVLMVLPTDLRPEAYRDIEVQNDDEILMVNKEKIKSVKTFEKIYTDLEIGAEFKMGLRRNGQLLMRSFKKLDPKDMPQGEHVRVMTQTEADGEDTGGTVMRRIVGPGGPGADDIRPLFGTGLLVGTKENKIIVVDVMDHMSTALGNADIKVGDVITALNKSEIKSLDQLVELFDKIAIGKNVDLAYLRDGKKMALSFAKPEARGRMIIREN